MGLIVLGLQQSSTWGWGSAGDAGLPARRRRARGRVRRLGAAHARAAARPADLPRPRLRGRQRSCSRAVGRVRPVLLLRQRLRPGVARRERLEGRPLHHVLLPRLRGRGADRRPDPRPARRAARVVAGAAISAVGFFLLAGSSPTCRSARQWPAIMLAGAGIGLILGPASTDAVNRAPASATARSPASPRPRGTSARASASPSSARILITAEPDERHRRARPGRRAERPGREGGRRRSAAPARARGGRAARARSSCTTSSSRSPARPRPCST